MILNAPQPTAHINPVRMDPYGSWVTDLIWDHLDASTSTASRSRSARLRSALADPTTLEVVLRDGLKFHDGAPVTAEDVRYSFDMPQTQGKAPQFFPAVVNIDKVTIVDPRTLRFSLKAPQSSFLTATLSKIAIIPKHVWQPIMASLAGTTQTVEDYKEEKCVGSGPFRFVHWRDRKRSCWSVIPTMVAARAGTLDFAHRFEPGSDAGDAAQW